MATEEWHPTRVWNVKFVTLLMIEMMVQIGQYLVRPIASSYAVSLGASVTMGGVVAGTLAIAALCVRPVCGVMSDIFSKKSVLVVSAALFAIAAFGMALVTAVPALVFFAAIQGIAFSFKSTTIISLTSLVVPQENVGSAVGWLSIGYTVACSLGPAFATMMIGLWGFRPVYFIAAGAFGIALILALSFKAPAGADGELQRQGARLGEVLHSIAASFKPSTLFHMPTVPITCVAGLLMIAQGTISSYMVLLQTEGYLQGAAVYFIVYALVSVATKPTSGRLCDKYGIEKVAPPMFIIGAVAMVILAISGSFVAVIAAAVCMAAGQASAYAALQGESVRGVENEQLGRAANTFFVGPDVGMGVGPIISGAVMSAAGVPVMFIVDAGFIVASLALFLILQARK